MRFNIFGFSNKAHRQTVIIRGIIVTLLSALISMALFMLVVRQYADMMFADFLYAVIQGSEYDHEETEGEINISGITDGTIDSDEWASPVVDEQYGYITCDGIGMNVPLYYGDSNDILAKGAGQSVSSYLPGQGGTVLVGGHDTTFFGCLEGMKEGMEVNVSTRYGVFGYKVGEINKIEGSEYGITHGKEQLVLYTCYPFGKNDRVRTKKILYICDKVSGPVIGGASNEQ